MQQPQMSPRMSGRGNSPTVMANDYDMGNLSDVSYPKNKNRPNLEPSSEKVCVYLPELSEFQRAEVVSPLRALRIKNWILEATESSGYTFVIFVIKPTERQATSGLI